MRLTRSVYLSGVKYFFNLDEGLAFSTLNREFVPLDSAITLQFLLFLVKLRAFIYCYSKGFTMALPTFASDPIGADSIQPDSTSAHIVVIYSGGLDSFTLLHKALANGYQVSALSFDYGQRHKKELQYATQVCQRLSIPHKVVDIGSIQQLLLGSALTDKQAMPEGEYSLTTMQTTLVPNRNMILLSLAIGYAVSLKASEVWYGAHSGNHEIYPDCRPEFVQAMNQVSQIANYQAVKVVAPYLHQSKTEIVLDGLNMGLDYSQTWTCYQGQELACGRCSACLERQQAFADNQQQDPLLAAKTE